jgi:hypothetical protein
LTQSRRAVRIDFIPEIFGQPDFFVGRKFFGAAIFLVLDFFAGWENSP